MIQKKIILSLFLFTFQAYPNQELLGTNALFGRAALDAMDTPLTWHNFIVPVYMVGSLAIAFYLDNLNDHQANQINQLVGFKSTTN